MGASVRIGRHHVSTGARAMPIDGARAGVTMRGRRSLLGAALVALLPDALADGAPVGQAAREQLLYGKPLPRRRPAAGGSASTTATT